MQVRDDRLLNQNRLAELGRDDTLLRRTGLWDNSDFLKLWAGETVSDLRVASRARGADVHGRDRRCTPAPSRSGCWLRPGSCPSVLFGLFAGVWVDRLRKRPLMIVADIARFVLLATIPLAYAFDALTIGQLFVVAFGTGAFTILFDVAYHTYLPALVEKDAHPRRQLQDGGEPLRRRRSAGSACPAGSCSC